MEDIKQYVQKGNQKLISEVQLREQYELGVQGSRKEYLWYNGLSLIVTASLQQTHQASLFLQA